MNKLIYGLFFSAATLIPNTASSVEGITTTETLIRVDYRKYKLVDSIKIRGDNGNTLFITKLDHGVIGTLIAKHPLKHGQPDPVDKKRALDWGYVPVWVGYDNNELVPKYWYALDTDTNVLTFSGNKQIPEFIENLKKGKSLNIAYVHDGEAHYERFNLSGFTKLYDSLKVESSYLDED